MNDLRLDIAKRHFEIIKSVDEDGNESWSARDLMPRLGYDRWENFESVIKKAIRASENAGLDSMGQFREVTKPLLGANGAVQMIKDYRLTRYACYLIAQNGNPKKEEVALAQTYFAIQTRKQEVAQESAKELERLSAREKLTATEKKFSGVMFDKGIQHAGIAQIRARGDKKLFGGRSTDDMKRKLAVPPKRPLADFLPTVTVKAKDLATEMTTFKTQEKGLNRQESIAVLHEDHNASVRKALVDQGIHPEDLPPEVDIKKLQRKIKNDQKKLASAEKPLKINAGFSNVIGKIANADLEKDTDSQ